MQDCQELNTQKEASKMAKNLLLNHKQLRVEADHLEEMEQSNILGKRGGDKLDRVGKRVWVGGGSGTGGEGKDFREERFVRVGEMFE